MGTKFDLEAAMSGAEVQTRDGKLARIICFDAVRDGYPIIALVYEETTGQESVCHYNSKGICLGVGHEKYDLLMKSMTHEGWINIYKHPITTREVDWEIYKTKKEAVEKIYDIENIIDTVHIEWEE